MPILFSLIRHLITLSMFKQEKDGKFSKEPKANPKDRITIEIGDLKQAKFYPQKKIMRWDNEVNVSIRLIEDDDEIAEAPTIIEEDGRIKHIKSKRDCHFYDIDPCGEHPEGASEFEIILKEKPVTNLVQFTLSDKGIDYFYQPELTDEEIANGSKQPENAKGSYAVYAKNLQHNIEGSKEYKCGKVGHIYRPRIVDANGLEVWGELSIDKKVLTVTIPQEFLDVAAYPVSHAAGLTFGYTSAGVNMMQYAANGIRCSLFTGASGTVTKLTLSVSDDNGGAGFKGLIIRASGSSIITNGVGSVAYADIPQQWVDSAISNAAVNAEDYYLGAISNSSLFGVFYDAGGSIYYQTSNSYASPTNPTLTYANANKLSIYATYTAGVASAIKSVNSLLKASVKSFNGLVIASVKSIDGLQ